MLNGVALKRRLTAAVAVALAAALSACSGDSGEKSATGAVPATDFVALGDSYAAGVGAGNYGDDKNCMQSKDGGYPQLFVKARTAATFGKVTDVSCGGAVINDVRYEQLSALSDTTGWVTLTVGGNDVGWSTTVQQCLLGTDATCKASVEQAAAKAQSTLPAALDDLYTAIRGKAPNAKVFVLGYPHLVAEPGKSGVSCESLTDPRREALNKGADSLVEIIKARVAAQQGFTFVDVRAAFKGHGACTADPWVNGFTGNLAEAFHPNPEGYQAYLKELLAVAS